MYKNIIFDLGGVVVDFKPRDFLMDHFLNKSAEDEVFDLTFGSKEWEELDRGVISRGTANRLMLETLLSAAVLLRCRLSLMNGRASCTPTSAR